MCLLRCTSFKVMFYRPLYTHYYEDVAYSLPVDSALSQLSLPLNMRVIGR